MWLIVGALCAQGFACMDYPVTSTRYPGLGVCMMEAAKLHDDFTGFAPYTSLRCRRTDSKPQRRME